MGRKRPEKHLEKIPRVHNYDNDSQKGLSLRFLGFLFLLSAVHPLPQVTDIFAWCFLKP